VAASFLFSQMMSGLTTAMFLFLIASGLSLVFGVMRVINFAHGSFYMIGAYLAWQWIEWLHPAAGAFWPAALLAALGVAVLGGVVERLLLRHLYGVDELYQLLFTYALVLILGDAAKFTWGTDQLSVNPPAALAGSIEVFGTPQPLYSLFIIALGPLIAFLSWLGINRTGVGRLIRAAAYDREMLDALGANVGSIYTGMFMFS
jgi:branched-chain amino acid transport system permease protein